MPRHIKILDRILPHSNAGQTGRVERSAVRSAETATTRIDSARNTKIGKRLKGFPQDGSCFRRTEYAHAACTAGAAVDVEISIEFRPLGFRILERSEVLSNVRL